jgi:hypothetical protein
MKFRSISGALAALIFCGLAVAQGVPDRAKLVAGDLFFSEPYTVLQPPVRDLVGLDLGLDYIATRYRYGFANAAAGDQPVAFRQRMLVKDPESLKKIEKQTGLKVGQPITLVAPNGQGVPGKIVSFSFVGDSPSTIIVAADVKPDRNAAEVTAAPSVALRGLYNLAPVAGLAPAEPMKKNDPERARLVTLCANDLGTAFTAQDEDVTTAALAVGGEPRYFVSFWKQPRSADFEIDDIELYSCMFRQEGQNLGRANLPIKFRLISVQDLDRDGKAEIFAQAGDGAEICHLYLTPKGEGYTTLKKGLCAGY